MTYRTACAVLACLAISKPLCADDLIFADILNFNDPLGNSIRRVRTDGTNLETLIATGGGVRGIDVDAAAGLIYWTDVDNFVIRRAQLNGLGQQDLITTGLVFPAAIRISVPTNTLFWGDAGSEAESMYRADLDGGFPQLLNTSVFYRGIAVDAVNSRLYWTTSSTATTGQIRRGNFFGGDEVVVLGFPTPVSKPGSIAVDAAGGKMYWTEQPARFIRRANLDGTNVEPLFNASAIGPPKGIALDIQNGKVYWGQDVEDEGFIKGQIFSMDLNGTGIQLIADDLGSVNDIVLVRTGAPPCYANCDGSSGQPVLTANDFLCFINSYANQESYANCDGSTGMPALTGNDFTCFINAFALGCT